MTDELRMQSFQDRNSLHRRFMEEAIPHMDAVYNFALHTCHDREVASDLVQETYLRAYRSFKTFSPGTNCKAWLFQILKNSFYTLYRKNQARQAVTLEEGFGHPLEDCSDSRGTTADMMNIDLLFEDEVTRALDHLPGIYRTVLILSDIEGFRYDEIASFTGCPVGTVRSRLHRARKMVAESLTRYAQRKGYLQVA